MAKQETKGSTIEVVISNKLGLHARAAALLRETAQKYECSIKVIRDYSTADAKSLLGLLALGASRGTVLKISAEGSDMDVALDALKKLIENKFNEQE